MGRSESNNSPRELVPAASVNLSDSEEEADNLFIENEDGYQLLADNDIQEPEDNQLTLDSEVEAAEINDNHTDAFIEISNPEKDNETSRDINVDFEQVRTVMSRVILPTNAIPAWAAELPEAELDLFLRDRITSIQQRNSLPSESKP